MTRMMWLAAPALLAAQTLACADDAHTIKLKKAGVGDVVLVENTFTNVTETKTIDAEGKVVSDDKQKDTEKYLYRETIIAQETGKSPTKIRRDYDKAWCRQDDTTTDFPYARKTLVIERQKDGKFHFQIEGGTEVTGDDAWALNNEFNSSDEFRDFEHHFLPDHPVKVEEDWKLDMAPIVLVIGQACDMEGDAAKGRGTAKLVTVSPEGDRKLGRFLAHYEFPVRSTGSGKDKEDALEGSILTSDYDMAACIDSEFIHEVLHWKSESTLITKTALKDGTLGKKIVIAQTDSAETDREQPKK